MPKIFDFLHSRQLRDEASVQSYHNSDAIGHTKIVNFETYGPTALRKDFTIHPTDAMEFGSIVDTLLTRGSEFTNVYYIPSLKIKTTPSESVFVDYIVSHEYNPYALTDDELLEILNQCKTYAMYTKNTDARITKAKQLFPLIVERLRNANKKVITPEQFKEATDCINAIKTSDITKCLFEDPNKLLFQVELFDRSLNVHCLFDMIYVDFENKTIHPIDLKCVSYPERDFLSNSFYKFKYYRQAELYMYILRQNIDHYDAEEWKIAPFKFLVVCRNTLSPMLYEFPIKYNDKKLVISENREVDDMFKIISDIQWHINNQQYMYDKDTYMQLFKQKESKSNQLIVKPIIEVPEEERNITLSTLNENDLWIPKWNHEEYDAPRPINVTRPRRSTTDRIDRALETLRRQTEAEVVRVREEQQQQDEQQEATEPQESTLRSGVQDFLLSDALNTFELEWSDTITHGDLSVNSSSVNNFTTINDPTNVIAVDASPTSSNSVDLSTFIPTANVTASGAEPVEVLF